MASVDFMKRSGARSAKAIIRHSVTDERLKNNHSNPDIDKSLTEQNWSVKGLEYDEMCDEYDARISELDNTTNTNKRKDRVTMFSLDVPVPRDLPKENIDEWFENVYAIFTARFGEKNIIDMCVHKDEIHEYIDPITKEKCISREHAHAFVVPEKDGKLCGKELE